MSLPTNDLVFPAQPAPFLPPRDRPKLTNEDWTLGGAALSDATTGLSGWTWRFEVDPSTGVVSIERDGVTVNTSWYTIPGTDPANNILVDDFAASFDNNMQPVLGWTLSDGTSYFRWFDPTIPGFSVVPLVAGSYCVRVAMDDPRDSQHDVRDTIIAYVRDNHLYYRQLRDRFENEYLLTGSGGMIFLYQIGMNELLRMQFSRSGQFTEENPQLQIPVPSVRADTGPYMFDANGNLVAYDGPPLTVIQGPAGFNINRSASGTTFHVQKHDGTFVTDAAVGGETRGARLDFMQLPSNPTGSRQRLYTTDFKGVISLFSDENFSDKNLRYREVTAPGTLTGMFRDQLGNGRSFNVATIVEGAAFASFTPNYAATGDFAKGLAPAGVVDYVDTSAHVTLSIPASHVGQSSSTMLRWPAGTIPAALRPSIARTVPCVVTADTVSKAAGFATINPDGSAQFRPLSSDTVSDTPVVNYAKFTYTMNTAGALVIGGGQHQWIAPAALVDFLLVGGGGRGGRGYRIAKPPGRNYAGGGGGAGRVRQVLNVALVPGNPYVIKVGAGGTVNGSDSAEFSYGADPLGNSGKNTTGHPSRRAGDSAVLGLGDAVLALGGGFGGHANRFPANGEPGFGALMTGRLTANPDMAGNGGGAGNDPGDDQLGGSGYRTGGDSLGDSGNAGGGGGGGNAPGSDGLGDDSSGADGGDGGAGRALSAMGWGDAVAAVGAPTHLGAAGGGAGMHNAVGPASGTGGDGGSGIGGDGADGVATASSTGNPGGNATPDTGSGGGGACGDGQPGNGADGLVLARWISAGASFGLSVPGSFIAGGQKGLPAGFQLTYPK